MYETGNWLVPTNAGEPFMEKPPLYYWTATVFSHLLSGVMPLYDAARSASLFFSIINFSFFVLLARRFFKSEHFADARIWTAFALYVCAPGVLRHTHEMFTDVSLMTGATIGLYGLLGLIQQQKLPHLPAGLPLGQSSLRFLKGYLFLAFYGSAYYSRLYLSHNAVLNYFGYLLYWRGLLLSSQFYLGKSCCMYSIQNCLLLGFGKIILVVSLDSPLKNSAQKRTLREFLLPLCSLPYPRDYLQPPISYATH